MKLKQPQIITPGRMWHPQKPKPFEPAGIDLGSWVTFEHRSRTVTGQVWCKAGPRTWWVADGTEYTVCYESELRLIQQAGSVQERIAV